MAISYVPGTHDIGFLRSDGTTKVGMMLAHRKGGSPDYEVVEESPIAEQMATSAPDYGSFRPTREFAIVQNDWRQGLGKYIDSGVRNPQRYHSASKVDCRFPNMAIPGPVLTSVTKPSHSLTITNSGMETAASGWTNGDRSDTYAQAGSYSWLVGGAVTATQNLTGQLPGVSYTFTCYVRDNGADHTNARVNLYDGTTTTNGTTTATTGSWQQLTVTARIPLAGCTNLQLQLDNIGAQNCWFDTAAITANITVGTTKAMCEYSSDLIASFGSLVAKLNGAGTAFTLLGDLGSTITSMRAFADGYLWFGLEDSTVIENCDDAWNESVNGNVTSTADTTDYKDGTASAKLVCAAAFSAAPTIAATEAMSALDLSQKTGIKFWIKSSVALAAADWQFLIDETASCGSPSETLDIPALTANTWTHVYLAFAAAASTRDAIISVGVQQAVDKGAMTLWLDDVKAENHLIYMNAGETFTQVTQSDGFGKFLEVVNGASPTLYKALPPNEIKSNTAPASGAWSAATSVDTPYYNITGLLSSENSLYILKEDRAFYLDSTGAVKVLADDTRKLASTSGGKNSMSWQERTYMPYGTQSLVEYDEDGDINWRDPAIQMSNLDDYDGQIVALTADERYLYAAVLGATNIYVLAASYESIDGLTDWYWHGSLTDFTVAAYTSVELLFFSNIYARRIWIASTNASADFNYISVPNNYGDPVTDGNRSFQTGGTLVTPYFHLDFVGDQKSFFTITANLGHSYNANIYITASYQKIGDSGWTTIGNLIGTSSNRSPSAFIPVDGSSLKPTTRLMRFKFTFVTNSATTAPVLLSYDVRGRLYPTKRKLIQCTVRGADSMLVKQGLQDETGAYIKTTLDEANTATWPVTFYDPFYVGVAGTEKTVSFVDMREVVLTNEPEPQNRERGYQLVMQEITLS